MSDAHIPVLLDEVIGALKPVAGDVYVDGTFGAGGYTQALLAAGAKVFAFDRDPSAIAAGRDRFADAVASGQLTLIERPFDEMVEALREQDISAVHGVVLDVGVSSMQLDQASRGFSFMADGPLDMRMGEGRSAAALLADVREADLADIIHQYGEERRARHITNLIVAARREDEIVRTGQLADIAVRALGRSGKVHPATRLFQALRIFVNDELGQIVRVLMAAEQLLVATGRLAVVTFHSLEDRIVKRFLAAVSGSQPGGSRHDPVVELGPPATFQKPLKPVAPSSEEVARNVRARSARLRVAVRNDASPTEWDEVRLGALGAPPMVFSDVQRKWRTVV